MNEVNGQGDTKGFALHNNPSMDSLSDEWRPLTWSQGDRKIILPFLLPLLCPFGETQSDGFRLIREPLRMGPVLWLEFGSSMSRYRGLEPSAETQGFSRS